MNKMKKTKIIATLGPSSESPKMIQKLIEAGTDIFRLNFSHDTHQNHGERMTVIRKVAKNLKKEVAILADLQGPKIRIGNLHQEPLELKEGTTVTLTAKDIKNPAKIPVQFPSLTKDIQKKESILIDDGKLKLLVLKNDGHDLTCRVVVGGPIVSKKGLNFPNSKISAPSLSAKDKKDLAFALNHGVDFVALSFVKNVGDILELKKLLERAKSKAKIIAKIEQHEAIHNLDGIINVSDALMIARGDLGIEISQGKVPILQKQIIKKCNQFAKPVIVATQMLESMITSPRSTRAETSDVANAILDGADAVMLSAETSIGKYPLETVRAMNSIALLTERWLSHGSFPFLEFKESLHKTQNAIAKAAYDLASFINARAIIVATESGAMAHLISRHKPKVSIIALASTQKVARQLNLVWGVIPFAVNYKNVEGLISHAKKMVLTKGIALPNDRVVIVSGQLAEKTTGTHIIKVETL